MFENGNLLETMNLFGKSERYAEDCAENWVLSILQIKKAAADNASTEGHVGSDWCIMSVTKINDITRNLEEFHQWRGNKHRP